MHDSTDHNNAIHKNIPKHKHHQEAISGLIKISGGISEQTDSSINAPVS
jgi:hypothetical protein